MAAYCSKDVFGAHIAVSDGEKLPRLRHKRMVLEMSVPC